MPTSTTWNFQEIAVVLLMVNYLFEVYICFRNTFSPHVPALKKRNVNVIEVVERLGCLLTNPAAEKREVGTLILTMVLDELPDNYFISEDLKFVCTFYADRLKDNHIVRKCGLSSFGVNTIHCVLQVVPAVLRGIFALTKFTDFPDGSATELLLSLFNNIACQQQQQEDRNIIYRIFKSLFKRKTEGTNRLLYLLYVRICGILLEAHTLSHPIWKIM